MKRMLPCLALLGLLSANAHAVETSTWTQSSSEEFQKGKRERVALRSDGTLMLAPAVKELLDAGSGAVWALAADSSGAVYAAAPAPEGGKVRVFRMPSNGPAETVADVEGLTAFALAVDARNRVYVGVSPQSRIYRIENGVATLFYTAPAEYIWQMAFTADGHLMVATGDKGVIYRVSPQGQGEVFFETEETHVRALLLDAQGNVYAGTAPGALVMRISPRGEGFVLHQSEREEIAALAGDAAGNLYAAALGPKRSLSAPRPIPTPLPAPPPPATQGPAQPQASAPRPQGQAQPAAPAPRSPLSGGSEVLQIQPNGFPTVLWESDREYVYALAMNRAGRIVAGTGNEGGLYELEAPGKSTALLNAAGDQVTALLTLAGGGIAYATSNIGKVFQAGPEVASDGVFESSVFDSEFFATWGKLSALGNGDDGAVAMSVRSGNVNRPRKDWSPWSGGLGLGEDQPTSIPPARYLQWRAELKRGNGEGPRVRLVSVAYRNRNVPPTIAVTEATPPNYAFPPRSLSINPSDKITLNPLSGKARPVSTTMSPAMQSGALGMSYSKGHVGVRWLAEDANRDELTYKLEIRPVGGGNWMTLAEKLEEPQYSWDSTAWPDGLYEVRVHVHDGNSNPPAEALTGSATTEAFLVDNTKPVIADLGGARTGTGSAATATLRWKATDAHSQLRRAEYSLNGKDWTRIEPRNGLSDARALDYELVLRPAPEAGSVVTVRVRDEFDNEAVASVTIRD
ncbi:MAG: hypothetical protein MUF01_11590 [Bryobacterales bacterium]|jgi:hypothetical protein|nr:hypothetical protein [Bryobacterales bacterium]